VRRLAPDWAWPARLVRFDPVEWTAGPAWQRWQEWLHARADFADWNGIDADDIPDETPRDVKALMQASVWNPSPTDSAARASGPRPSRPVYYDVHAGEDQRGGLA